MRTAVLALLAVGVAARDVARLWCSRLGRDLHVDQLRGEWVPLLLLLIDDGLLSLRTFHPPPGVKGSPGVIGVTEWTFRVPPGQDFYKVVLLPHKGKIKRVVTNKHSLHGQELLFLTADSATQMVWANCEAGPAVPGSSPRLVVAVVVIGRSRGTPKERGEESGKQTAQTPSAKCGASVLWEKGTVGWLMLLAVVVGGT